MRVKSFGLIEAMIASFIAITVLSAAVALSGSVNKSTTTDSSYSVAERLADNYLENLNFANSQGRVYFNSRPPHTYYDASGPGPTFFIDCFDTAHTDACKTEYSAGDISPDFFQMLWDQSLTKADTDGYYSVQAALVGNESFPNDFFKIKATINYSLYKNASGTSLCPSVSTVEIPKEKCRVVDVEVKWTENTGDNTYKVSKYITDWTR